MESSLRNNSNNNKSRVSERLNQERMKAFETLQKSQNLDKTKKLHTISIANKENQKGQSTQKSPNLDQTDYVPLRRPNTINISDLITDETIHLENSSPCPPASSTYKDSKISFEPTEITGRSTLYKSDLNLPRSAGAASRMSVSEILASSFAPKARDLCETLRSGGNNTLNLVGKMDVDKTVSSAAPERVSAIGSSFTSFNGSRSLPRTADMSSSKTSGTELSLDGCSTSFSFMATQTNRNDNDSAFSSEEFAPGELMQSKLLMDEISWAQEYAAIPTAALSEQAKAKVESALTKPANESISSSNSMLMSDADFSIGKFFNLRSDNIWDIVNSQSPAKCRTPVALVAEDTTVSTDINSIPDIDGTPKIDNRTYSKVIERTNDMTATAKENSNQPDKSESKDSGHDSRNSYLLSLSAIDRALCNLDVHTDDSEIGVVNQILTKSKPSKSPRRSPQFQSKILRQSLSGTAQQRATEVFERISEILSENKENLDPQAIREAVQFSDTISFSESLLNTSDSKQLQHSGSQPRSPLSPITLLQPEIKVTAEDDDEQEADIDEWPSTPVKAPHRRVRRSKSPHYNSSPNKSLSPIIDSTAADKSPINKNQSKINRSPSPLPKLSSRSPMPSFSSNVTSTCGHTRGSDTGGGSNNTTLTAPGSGPGRRAGCDNTANLDGSPMSSPRSCLSSPMNGFRSPQLDSTTNSEGRYLYGGAVRDGVSSPVASEPGARKKHPANHYGGAAAPPSRSCSCTSLKSVGGPAVRSMSRCSNSSEYSHRDGKVIPLKVTALELSWSSTKLRTNVHKSMQVKNIADKRLIVRMEVSGPGFQMINAQSNTLTLQSQECRSIVINFCPTVVGAAIGSLAFYSPQGSANSSAPILEIPLYGYGGNATIITQDIYVGPVGSAFLTMGALQELNQPLERTFKVINKGSLLGFAIVALDSNGLNLSRLCDTFEVQPRVMMIPPGGSVTVNVIFRPKRDDIKKIVKKIQNVLTLANMRVLTGDDANRQRMRRLVQGISFDERAKLSSPTLDQLWTKFPGEVELHGLGAFKERPTVVFDLLNALHVHEIALTLNHEFLDETADSSSLYYPDGDDTVLFRTVCVASPSPQPMLDRVDELLEDTSSLPEDEGAVTSTREGCWTGSPHLLEFDLYSARHPTAHSHRST